MRLSEGFILPLSFDFLSMLFPCVRIRPERMGHVGEMILRIVRTISRVLPTSLHSLADLGTYLLGSHSTRNCFNNFGTLFVVRPHGSATLRNNMRQACFLFGRQGTFFDTCKCDAHFFAIFRIGPERFHPSGDFRFCCDILLIALAERRGYTRTIRLAVFRVLILTDLALPSRFQDLRMFVVVTLHSLSLCLAEVFIFPQGFDMLGMEMKMLQELHALYVGRAVIPAIEVLVMSDVRTVKGSCQPAFLIITVSDVMDKFILTAGRLQHTKVVVQPVFHGSRIEVAWHQAIIFCEMLRLLVTTIAEHKAVIGGTAYLRPII